MHSYALAYACIRPADAHAFKSILHGNYVHALVPFLHRNWVHACSLAWRLHAMCVRACMCVCVADHPVRHTGATPPSHRLPSGH